MRSFRAAIENNSLYATGLTDVMIHTQAEGVSQPDGVVYLVGASFRPHPWFPCLKAFSLLAGSIMHQR